MRAGAAFILLLSACSRKDIPTPVDSGVVGVSTGAGTSSATADAQSTLQRFAVTRTVVLFDKDDLDECVDFSFSADRPFDGGSTVAALDDLTKKMKGTTITKRCSEQFAARVALGTCVVRDTGDAGVLDMSSSRYRFADVGLSDAALKECLEMGGSWNELDHSSAAWREAKMKNLHQDATKLQKQLDR